MKYYAIIPAHNEEAFMALTLQSLAEQSLLPTKVVVVDDNSTDGTAAIVSAFAEKYSWISLVTKKSDAVHMPGSKVIQAFQKGYESVDDAYDIIVKLDADLILPADYFETVINTFKGDARVGMAGGFAYIEKDGKWVLENLTDKDHIRGAFKAYRKELYLQMEGLRPAMGWDTADELIARFFDWKIVTIESLKVKHLKPTGANYNKAARYKQGEAFYTLGYGFLITAIAGAKLAMRKKEPLLFLDYVNGFLKAKKENRKLLVSPEQAKFIRAYRWRKMKEKIF